MGQLLILGVHLFQHFAICDLVILEVLMINHKNTTSQLEVHDSESQKPLRDLLKELRKLHCYRLQVSISQELAIDNVAYYNPF